MLPTAVAVALATVAMTLIPALVMWWAWRRGFFHDLAGQSRVIFDDRDWRVARPWESPVDHRLREIEHGALLPARPGEWGDAGDRR